MDEWGPFEVFLLVVAIAVTVFLVLNFGDAVDSVRVVDTVP